MTVCSFIWHGFLDLFFGSYGKMFLITSTNDTKSCCYWESHPRGVELSKHLDLHRAPPYLRSFLLPLLLLWKQRSFGRFGLDLGFFEDYIYSEPESRKNLPTSDSLILQIALSIEMSAAMPSSSNVLFGVMSVPLNCVAGIEGKAEHKCGDSASPQRFNNSSCFNKIVYR